MLNKKYRLRYLPIFYVVIHDVMDIPIMEVRRFLYNGQDQHKIV